MEIEGRKIGSSYEPYIVIEIGAGWSPLDPLGSCCQLIEAAQKAGADAAKIQLYKPQDLTVEGLPPLDSGPWAGQTLWEIYSRGALPEEIVPHLFEKAREVGITLFASVFSERVIPILENLGCPAYKVASAEANHFDLLWALNDTTKPVIISVGASTDAEIQEALSCFTLSDVALLHCVTEYPAEISQMELVRIPALQRQFDPELIGLSDHSNGSVAAITAVPLGACIIEKHVAMPGTLDACFAMRPYELHGFVANVRAAWEAARTMTVPEPGPWPLRRSLRATRDIKKGEPFTKSNTAILRPAGGADPSKRYLINGFTAKTFIKMGAPVNLSDAMELGE